MSASGTRAAGPVDRLAPALDAGPLALLATSLAFTVLYALAAVAGHATRLPDSRLVLLLWPPAVVTFTWSLAVLRAPKLLATSAPLLAAATIALALLRSDTLGFALFFLLVNLVHGLVAALVFRGLSGRDRPTLLTQRDAVALLWGALAGGAAGGLTGACWIAWHAGASLGDACVQIGLRNATTTLLLGALVSVTASPRSFGLQLGRRRAESAALLTVTATATYVVGVAAHGLPLGFILLPLAIWAGMRFGVRVSTWYSAVLGVFIVGAGLRGNGPWATVPDLTSRALITQAFIAALTITGVGVAVVEEGRLAALLEARRSQEELSHQALHDPLTGLPNRTLLYDRVAQALERQQRGAGMTALLFFDLDRFKTVNDSLGHASGDALLFAVAERFRAAVRPSDTVARIGGDEFVIICPDLTSRLDAEVVAQRVMARVGHPVVLPGGHVVTPSASGGITMSRPGMTADDLIREADSAMFQAKSTAPGRVEFFSERLHDAARRRLRLEDELRVAMGSRQFVLHYQPIVDLRSGDIDGVEALLRWAHPNLGLLPPGEWLDVAEDMNLLPVLGTWVLRQACGDAAAFADVAGRPVNLHVNVSPRQLLNPGLAEAVEVAVEKSKLARDSLVLEITEGSMLHLRRTVLAEFDALRERGVRLAADDFGTGYSSLSQLATMPIDVIKVDRCFVAALGSSDGADAVVHAVVAIADALHVAVVAEGVETQPQADRLRAEGIVLAQGHLWSVAVPAAAIIAMIRGATPSSTMPATTTPATTPPAARPGLHPAAPG